MKFRCRGWAAWDGPCGDCLDCTPGAYCQVCGASMGEDDRDCRTCERRAEDRAEARREEDEREAGEVEVPDARR